MQYKETLMNDDFPSRASCFGCALIVGVVLFVFLVILFSRLLGYWTFILLFLLLLAGAVGLLAMLWTWKPPAPGDR
jgi:hypothetical protein